MSPSDEQPAADPWESWQAEGAPLPPLLTRSEVLALVERWHTQPPVDERTMRYWEKRGLLPRPGRHYHAGATRSRYPAWVADLIGIIRAKQRAGGKLEEILPLVREEARRLSLSPRPHPFPSKPDYLNFLGTLEGPRFPPLPTYDPPSLPSHAERLILAALDEVMGQQYRLHGFETARITVHLVDTTGQERIYEVTPSWGTRATDTN